MEDMNTQNIIKDKSSLDNSISYQTLKEKPNTFEHLIKIPKTNDDNLNLNISEINRGMLFDDQLDFSRLIGDKHIGTTIDKLNYFYNINNFIDEMPVNKAKETLMSLKNSELTNKCLEIEKETMKNINTYKNKFKFIPYDYDDNNITKFFKLCEMISKKDSLMLFTVLMEAYGFKHFYGYTDNDNFDDNSVYGAENIKTYNKKKLLYIISNVLKMIKVVPGNMELTYDEIKDLIDHPFVFFYEDNGPNNEFLKTCLNYIIKHGPRYTFVFLSALTIHYIEKQKYCDPAYKPLPTLENISQEKQAIWKESCGDNKNNIVQKEQRKLIQNAITLSMLLSDKLILKLIRSFLENKKYVHDNQIEVHEISNDYKELVEKITKIPITKKYTEEEMGEYSMRNQ
tara:strand:+ start:992 stop:2185 length:1194 start_codon:yes stop_codon:yes gene_type:complete